MARARSAPQLAVMRLTSLAQVRVLANPLRLRLLDAFVAEPRTTMQVARVLGESPTRLYRHVDALFRAGFLERRGERKNRGTTEVYYQAKAGHFEADPGVFAKRGAAGASFRRSVTRLLRQTEQGLVAAEAAARGSDDLGGIVLVGLSVDGSAKDIARIKKRLQSWLESCATSSRGGHSWQGMIAFYPVAKP